jgi:hypothetical protein
MNKIARLRCGVDSSGYMAFVLAALIFFASGSLIAQGRRPQASTGVVADADKDNTRLRQEWFRRGRKAPVGESSAELRYRAHRQKINSRMLRARRLSALGMSPSSLGPAVSWVPLGPAPLASDATGQGFRDYGLVAGRATAVVVDPADATGNTVYVGGAYGGVWRSQNAATGSYGNASGVTWTALTDDQPTRAGHSTINR